jgi:hypothetical protein
VTGRHLCPGRGAAFASAPIRDRRPGRASRRAGRGIVQPGRGGRGAEGIRRCRCRRTDGPPGNWGQQVPRSTRLAGCCGCPRSGRAREVAAAAQREQLTYSGFPQSCCWPSAMTEIAAARPASQGCRVPAGEVAGRLRLRRGTSMKPGRSGTSRSRPWVGHDGVQPRLRAGRRR